MCKPPRRCELSLHKARLRKKERSEGAQTPSHLVPHICGHRDKTLKPSLTWKPTRLRSSATPDAGGGSARSMASGSTDTAPSQSSQKSCCGRLIPSRSTFRSGSVRHSAFWCGMGRVRGGAVKTWTRADPLITLLTLWGFHYLVNFATIYTPPFVFPDDNERRTTTLCASPSLSHPALLPSQRTSSLISVSSLSLESPRWRP